MLLLFWCGVVRRLGLLVLFCFSNKDNETKEHQGNSTTPCKQAMLKFLSVVAGSLNLLNGASAEEEYVLNVISHPSTPLIGQVDNTSTFSLIFNPTWVEASALTGGKEGLLMRTQDCPITAGDECSFCGGSQELASGNNERSAWHIS